MKKIILIIVVVLIGSLGGYFILREQKKVSDSDSGPKNQTEFQNSEALEGKEIKEFEVAGNEFSFNPFSLTVPANQKIKLIFKNKGRAPHNLTIEDLNFSSKTIAGGESDIIEFESPAAGNFEFFCSVSGHRAAGMKGQLKVE